MKRCKMFKKKDLQLHSWSINCMQAPSAGLCGVLNDCVSEEWMAFVRRDKVIAARNEVPGIVRETAPSQLVQ